MATHALRVAPVATICVILAVCVSGQGIRPAAAQIENKSAAEFTATLAYFVETRKVDDKWQLSIKFDGKPKTRIFLMDSPRRVVLELENATFNLHGETTAMENEMVESLRFGAVTADKSRLVITLKQPFSVVEKNLVAEEGTGRHTLDILLEKVSPETFSARVDEQEALLGTSGEVVVKGDRVRSGPKQTGAFSIVIDPGHGGIDGGSKGRNTDILEKEITLEMAMIMGPLIEKAGPVRGQLYPHRGRFRVAQGTPEICPAPEC